MAIYKKKVQLIEAVEFTGQQIKGVSIIENAFKKDHLIYQVYNKLHDSWIELSIGDMIRIDLAPDDICPIAKEYFSENYLKIKD